MVFGDFPFLSSGCRYGKKRKRDERKEEGMKGGISLLDDTERKSRKRLMKGG